MINSSSVFIHFNSLPLWNCYKFLYRRAASLCTGVSDVELLPTKKASRKLPHTTFLKTLGVYLILGFELQRRHNAPNTILMFWQVFFPTFLLFCVVMSSAFHQIIFRPGPTLQLNFFLLRNIMQKKVVPSLKATVN